MTKSELIAHLGAHRHARTGKDANDVVNTILGAIAQALHEGHRIEVRGFGSFVTVRRRAHVARNPRSGEPVTVADKYVPAFKAGKELRERVDRDKMIEGASRVCAEPSPTGATALSADSIARVSNPPARAVRASH